MLRTQTFQVFETFDFLQLLTIYDVKMC